MKSHSKRICTGAAATVLMMHAAQAQDAAARNEPEATSIEQIVVTARKIDENVQSVPVAITALSAEALEQQSVRVLSDIQSQVPNLQLQAHTTEPQALAVSIRGQKQNDVTLTVDPSVGLYVDGLYNPRTFGMRGALVDVERIEVLRGPQGTLYGRNTTGGAISLYTRDATNEYGAEVKLSSDNYGVNSTLIGNLPIREGMGLRVVAQRGNRDGYGHDGMDRELGSEDTLYFRAKLNVELTENIEAALFGSYQDNENGGGIFKVTGLSPARNGLPPGGPATLQTAVEMFGPGVLAPGNPNAPAQIAAAVAALSSYIGGDHYSNAGTYPSYSQFRGSLAGLDLKFKLPGDLQLRSITGYQSLDRINAQDIDTTPFTILDADPRSTEAEYYSQEVQLLGGEEDFNWVSGVYAGLEKGTEYTVATALPALNPLAPTQTESDVENTSLAGFAQANWRFLPTWRLTAGARYSLDGRQIEVKNRDGGGCLVPAPGQTAVRPPNAPANPSQCPRTFDDDYSAPSWLVSLDHEFSDFVMGYAKVSRGYRSGGQNFRGSNTIESFASFDPETVTEYEVGMKSEWLDRRLRVNLSAFHDDYKDIQRSVSIPTVTGNPSTLVTNAAEGTIDGVELETTVQPWRDFTFSAAVGWIDAGYDEFVDTTGDRSHESFGVPEWTASASARYERPLEFGDLSFQLDYHWQDDNVLFPDGALTPSQLTQKAYGLLNARVALNIAEWDADIAVFGKNLTDKEYFVLGISLEAALGYNYLASGEPRVIGVEIVKRFGGI
jgi:iron complex outermembrane recepter protein